MDRRSRVRRGHSRRFLAWLCVLSLTLALAFAPDRAEAADKPEERGWREVGQVAAGLGTSFVVLSGGALGALAADGGGILDGTGTAGAAVLIGSFVALPFAVSGVVHALARKDVRNPRRFGKTLAWASLATGGSLVVAYTGALITIGNDNVGSPILSLGMMSLFVMPTVAAVVVSSQGADEVALAVGRTPMGGPMIGISGRF